MTPSASPNAANDGDWCFPDTEEGILDAISKGATYLWASTIVFASHPLQTSSRLKVYEDRLRVVGQGPLVVDKYDDKEFVNNYLRALGGFTMPRNFEGWRANLGRNGYIMRDYINPQTTQTELIIETGEPTVLGRKD